MQERGVRSLDWEGPLGEEMARHSTIVWEIPLRILAVTVHGGTKSGIRLGDSTMRTVENTKLTGLLWI